MKGEIAMYLDLCLIMVLTIAVFTDIKSRRIPNVLIGASLVLAFIYHFYYGGVPAVITGLKGFGAGIGLLILPFMLGGMGAGDVKLLGVIGAFKGVYFAVSTFIWMALWGGVMAVAILLLKGQLMMSISRLGRGVLMSGLGIRPLSDVVSKEELSVYYPYAAAIALGVLTSYFKGW